MDDNNNDDDNNDNDDDDNDDDAGMWSTTPSSGSTSTPPSTSPHTLRRSSRGFMLARHTDSIDKGDAHAEIGQSSCLMIFSDKVILNNALNLGKDGTDIGSALKYYDSINLYMKQLRGALGELRDDIL